MSAKRLETTYEPLLVTFFPWFFGLFFPNGYSLSKYLDSVIWHQQFPCWSQCVLRPWRSSNTYFLVLHVQSYAGPLFSGKKFFQRFEQLMKGTHTRNTLTLNIILLSVVSHSMTHIYNRTWRNHQTEISNIISYECLLEFFFTCIRDKTLSNPSLFFRSGFNMFNNVVIWFFLSRYLGSFFCFSFQLRLL